MHQSQTARKIISPPHLKTETISNVHRSTSYSPLLLILFVNNNHVKTTIPAARLKSGAESFKLGRQGVMGALRWLLLVI